MLLRRVQLAAAVAAALAVAVLAMPSIIAKVLEERRPDWITFTVTWFKTPPTKVVYVENNYETVVNPAEFTARSGTWREDRPYVREWLYLLHVTYAGASVNGASLSCEIFIDGQRASSDGSYKRIENSSGTLLCHT